MELAAGVFWGMVFQAAIWSQGFLMAARAQAVRDCDGQQQQCRTPHGGILLRTCNAGRSTLYCSQ